MRGRDGGAGGGAPLAEGAIGVGAAGAGGQGAGGAGRQLARQLDGALTLALPAPVELGRGLHRHRPLVGRAGAGAARAGIDVRGAVVHRHAAAHQVRPPGPRRRLFPRPRFLAGGPLPRRATRGADLWHHPAATASARRAGDLAARRRPRRGARLPGSAVSQAGRPARAHGPLARPGRPRPGRDRPSLGVRPGQLAAVGRRPRPPGDPAGRAAALPALRRAPRRRGRPAHRRLLRPLRLPGRDLQGARLRRPRADLAAAVLRGAAAVQCHLPVVGAGTGAGRCGSTPIGWSGAGCASTARRRWPARSRTAWSAWSAAPASASITTPSAPRATAATTSVGPPRCCWTCWGTARAGCRRARDHRLYTGFPRSPQGATPWTPPRSQPRTWLLVLAAGRSGRQAHLLLLEVSHEEALAGQRRPAGRPAQRRRTSIARTRVKALSRPAPNSAATARSGSVAAATSTAPASSTVATAAAIFQSSPITKSYQKRAKPRSRLMATPPPEPAARWRARRAAAAARAPARG